MEYQKTFLEEIKSLLLYFVEFEEDNKILSKEYLSDCAIGDLDQQFIIMITNDESTFSAIFYPKKKSKGIMVSDFFLL